MHGVAHQLLVLDEDELGPGWVNGSPVDRAVGSWTPPDPPRRTDHQNTKVSVRLDDQLLDKHRQG
jgi:hypothetical protein